MSSLWTDAVWEDPDGGTVIVHGTMPTVVYPNAMRPRVDWHGLALLESPDIVDLWVQAEADEAESQGINLTHALLSGGAFGKYIEGIETLEDLQGGRFPDPEPRRLQRNALRRRRGGRGHRGRRGGRGCCGRRGCRGRRLKNLVRYVFFS